MLFSLHLQPQKCVLRWSLSYQYTRKERLSLHCVDEEVWVPFQVCGDSATESKTLEKENFIYNIINLQLRCQDY